MKLKSGSPNMATVRSSARSIASLSEKASGWFPPGTGPNVGKTGAKAEIWQNQNRWEEAVSQTNRRIAGLLTRAAALSARAAGSARRGEIEDALELERQADEIRNQALTILQEKPPRTPRGSRTHWDWSGG